MLKNESFSQTTKNGTVRLARAIDGAGRRCQHLRIVRETFLRR
jgi:hypothetical protein